MRVERLVLDDDLDGGQVDFGEPLTVLFGANSSGKTRLLETIASIVAGDPILTDRRSVPGGLNVLRKDRVVFPPNIFSSDECALVASAFDLNDVATISSPNDHDAPRKAADAIAGTGPEVGDPQ